MKDCLKTTIIILVVLVMATIIFLIVGNVKYGVELLTRTKLIEKDPTVSILFERINGSNSLRKASLNSEDLTSNDIITFVIDNISADEYKDKKYETTKIVCSINDTISFTSNTSKCNVRIIENDLFYEYQKKYFGQENEISFEDFEYRGLNCKNDGDKYYCLIGNYENTVLGYSAFLEAYEEKDKVVIFEYYLRIDLANEAKCLKYFDKNYCENYSKLDKPEIDKDKIKNDGVLYQHEFKESDNNYYLEKSFIVSER